MDAAWIEVEPGVDIEFDAKAAMKDKVRRDSVEDEVVDAEIVEDDVLSAALGYAAMGWKLLPVHPGTKRPIGDNWPERASSDPEVIASWFAGAKEGTGVCVHLGASGLVAIDVDYPDEVSEDLNRALGKAKGWRHRGNSGRMTFLFTDRAERTAQTTGHSWGEVKSGNGVIILAPSVHPHAPNDDPPCAQPEGHLYEWVSRPGKRPPMLPTPLQALVAPPRASETAEEGSGTPWTGAEVTQDHIEVCVARRAAMCAQLSAMGKGEEGGRNRRAYNYANALGHYIPHVLDREETVSLLMEACKDNGLVGEDGLRSVSATIRSGLRASAHEPQLPMVLPAWDTGEEDEEVIDWRGKVSMVDWTEFWSGDDEVREFLVPYLIPDGLECSIFSGPGVGKSLLALEWSVCLALGLPVLGEPTSPRTVLYIDHENDRMLLRERLEALGVEGADLSRLHYSLLGDWEPLDTVKGGAQVAFVAKEVGADLVVIDTTAMVISGAENDSDTFHRLAQHTLRPLKALGIASLRLDHTGKDEDRGERGSSSKRGQVDLAYSLRPGMDDGVVILRRHKNRPHLPDHEVTVLRRTEDPLRHVVEGLNVAEDDVKIQNLITKLDLLGVPGDASIRTCQDALRKADGHGVGKGNGLLDAAVRRRKNRAS